jgi:hypothetical protein
MRRGLSFARRLNQLKNIQNKSNGLDVDAIQSEFLSLSSRSSNKVLKVKTPNLYVPKEEEREHLEEALALYDLNLNHVNGGVDISGGFNNEHLKHMIFLSSAQLQSEHINSKRSYLNPLIEEIYSKGLLLLRDFTIHNALTGEIKAHRGNLDLEEVFFPGNGFKSGPYALGIQLDSPENEVSDFMELKKEIAEMRKDPQNKLSDSKVLELAKTATCLKKIFGALTRYEIGDLEFSVESNSYVRRSRSYKHFFLYNPDTNQNVLVYFGKKTFDDDCIPKDLEVLDGTQQQKTLHKLVKDGFYKPSEKLLEDRLNIFKNLATNTEGGLTVGMKQLITGLEDIKAYFGRVLNPDMRIDYILNHSSDLLEFVSYPTQEEAIVHELLPMLSWNKNLRMYHHTNGFINSFTSTNLQGKSKLLTSVVSSILFDNFQNNDVNVWLYKNHKKIAEKSGIEFDVY